MFGYDAMKMLLQAVRTGAVSREQLVSALNAAGTFKGVHSKISFNLGRINSCLTLMQFKGRVVRKIGEIDVSKKLITGIE